MGTLLMGIGIGVFSTVGTEIVVASGCADRLAAADQQRLSRAATGSICGNAARVEALRVGFSFGPGAAGLAGRPVVNRDGSCFGQSPA